MFVSSRTRIVGEIRLIIVQAIKAYGQNIDESRGQTHGADGCGRGSVSLSHSGERRYKNWITDMDESHISQDSFYNEAVHLLSVIHSSVTKKDWLIVLGLTAL